MLLHAAFLNPVPAGMGPSTSLTVLTQPLFITQLWHPLRELQGTPGQQRRLLARLLTHLEQQRPVTRPARESVFIHESPS